MSQFKSSTIFSMYNMIGILSLTIPLSILGSQSNRSCEIEVETYYCEFSNSSSIDQSCQEECFDSLTEALGYVQTYSVPVFVTIQLHSSLCFLDKGTNNTVNNSQIRNLTLTSDIGSVIHCAAEAGINFTGCNMNVEIRRITFAGCSRYGSLYFEYHHPNIEIKNVTVTNYTGIGLAFLNVTGTVVINDSNMTNANTPQRDGDPTTGLYVWSQLSATDHQLLFSLNNCHFTNNSAILPSQHVMIMPVTRGGGMYIRLKKTRNTNHIFINNCTFTRNTACLGGGLSVRSNSLSNTSIEVNNCNFYENMADIGSAIDFYCSLSPTHREYCSVHIRHSNFTNNSPTSDVVQMSSSIVSTNYMHLTLSGYILFSDNSGSGLAATETFITILKQSSVSFIGNRAQQGGGIKLVNSYVTLEEGTGILFQNNSALVRGGAIFSDLQLDIYIPYRHDCFIRYVEPNINPDNWNTTLRFEYNQALNGAAIFTTSLMPCLWNTNTTHINDSFCGWKSWNFSEKCCEQIATSVKKFQNGSYTLKMISGLPLSYHKVNLSVFDELEHNVTPHATFTMIPIEDNILVVAPNYNGSIVAYGDGPRTEHWYIQSIGDRTVTASMTIIMLPCPPGFTYESGDCVCRKNLHSILHCIIPNRTALIEIAYCVSSLSEDVNTTVYGRCIFATVSTGNISMFTPLEYDVYRFCERLNRTGLLCGNCMGNYTVDAFSDSFRCVQCSGSAENWLIFVLVDSFPVLLLFTVIVMLHISLTSGPVNGYIFSCQVITVTLEVIFIRASLEVTHTKHSELLTNILLIPCNIWSLDFFRIYKLLFDRPVCLGSGLKVMHILALRYLSAFYPLLFLIVTYILIELHARNCQCLVRLWRPLCCFLSRIRRSWDIRTSVVDAFAAFILLSYVKITRISILLTTFNTVHNITNSGVVKYVLHYDPTITYGDSEHIPFMTIGTVLLLTYGLFLPLLLILYQFHFLQRCLDCLKLNRNGLRIFMDAFQGCYKDGKDGGPDRRYFSGLYFVFRLMVFCTYNLFWSNKILFLTLQSFMILFSLLTSILRPYKKELYNVIDTFLFCVLAIVFGLHVFIFAKGETSLMVPDNVVYTSYALQFVPFVYFLCYMSAWLGKRILRHHKYCNLSAYGPIERSISWRYNDTYSVGYTSIDSNSGSNERLSLTATRSGEGTQRTSLKDSAPSSYYYGSINS